MLLENSLSCDLSAQIPPFSAPRFLLLRRNVPLGTCERGAVRWTGQFDALFTRFGH